MTSSSGSAWVHALQNTVKEITDELFNLLGTGKVSLFAISERLRDIPSNTNFRKIEGHPKQQKKIL